LTGGRQIEQWCFEGCIALTTITKREHLEMKHAQATHHAMTYIIRERREDSYYLCHIHFYITFSNPPQKDIKEKKNNLKNDNVESNSNQFPPPEFREIL
jgi:hypothetical protein